MRWAIPTSVAVHVGLVAAAWLFMDWKPEDLSLSEAAVSVDIVSMEEDVAEPTQTVSEATANLVSAGTTQVASEPEGTEAVEAVPVEPVQVAAAKAAEPVTVTAAVEPLETEPVVSAEVLTALAVAETPVAAPIPQVTDEAAPTVAETVAPSDAQILERLDQSAKLPELQPTPEVQEIATASISPVQPVESTIPVTIANLNPMPEALVEEVVDTPPIPAPRIVRKPVEAEQKPVEDKKPTEKRTEKKQPRQVASLGNGGEAEADSAAAKASGGTKGKLVTAGKGALDAYEGKVRAKFLKAVRKPKDSNRGEVRVLFKLDASGRVLLSKLSRSSGDDALDRAVMAAVERAAPYPPIPDGSGKSTWVFGIPVGFN